MQPFFTEESWYVFFVCALGVGALSISLSKISLTPLIR